MAKRFFVENKSCIQLCLTFSDFHENLAEARVGYKDVWVSRLLNSSNSFTKESNLKIKSKVS